MDAVGPQVHVVHTRQVPLGERLLLGLPGLGQLRDRRGGQALGVPRNCPSAGTKSPDESPCRYSSGSTSLDLRGLARPRRQDRRREPLPLTGFRVDTLVVDPRRVHRPPRPRRWSPPRLVVAVAHHQPPPVLVATRRRTGRSRRRPRPAAPRPASAAHPPGRVRRSTTTPTAPQPPNHRGQRNQKLQ